MAYAYPGLAPSAPPALTAAYRRSLRVVGDLCPHVPLVIIGGAAIALQRNLPTIRELDVCVYADHAELMAAVIAQPAVRRCPHAEQKLLVEGSEPVDVLPVGPEALASGKLVWPETEGVLATRGLELAYEHNLAVNVGGGTEVRVATVAAVAMMKIIAYIQNPTTRAKDIVHVGKCLTSYLEEDDERLWSGPALERPFDEKEPFLLGQDIGAIGRPRYDDVLRELLRQLEDPQGRTVRALAEGALGSGRDLAQIGPLVRAFRAGLEQHGPL